MEKIILFIYDSKNIELENNVNVPCNYSDLQNIKMMAGLPNNDVQFLFEEFTPNFEVVGFVFAGEFLDGFMKKAVI